MAATAGMISLDQSDENLIPGEVVAFGEEAQKPRVTDEEINRKYVKGEIRIVTETARYSLAGILAMLREKVSSDNTGKEELRYKLDPEYQRRHRWSVERKSRLIESFLMNVPVPPVFLYERDLARFEVMDGRQRLNALSEFYGNEFALDGLQYWTELHGRTYSTLPTKVRDGIDRRYISSIILLKETAADEVLAAQLKKMVFERLNSGGVALSHQETRNAIYDGCLNSLCLKLSRLPEFCALWGLPSDIPTSSEEEEDSEERDEPTNIGKRMYAKMEDVELILRFFAYRQIKQSQSGLNKISAFLDQFLIQGNKFSIDLINKYEDLFTKTATLVNEILGAQAFCRVSKDGKFGSRPTKLIYDPIMWIMSFYANEPLRSSLLKKKDEVINKTKEMYINNSDQFSGRRTNANDVQERNRIIAEVFNGIVPRK